MNSAPAYELPDGRESASSRFNAYLLNVAFEASTGEQRSAVGGGESVGEAVAAAREELPDGPAWRVAGWNHLYGE